MASKYVFLDSAYRNRHTHPNPADFVAPIQTSGVQGLPIPDATPVAHLGNPRDPVITGFPYTGRLKNSEAIGSQTVTLSDNEIDLSDFFTGMSITITNSAGTEESFAVTSYDGTTKVLSIAPNTFAGAFDDDAAYEIRPTNTVKGTSASAQAATDTSITLAAGSNSTDDYYNGAVITITTESGDETVGITDYVGATRVATITALSKAVDVGDPYVIKGVDDTTQWAFTSPTTSTFVLTGGSSVDDFYNGMFVRIRDTTLPTNGADDYTSVYNEFLRITDYVGSTRTATLSGNFTAAPNTTNNRLEILGWDENFRGLIYRGRPTTQQICYEMEMNSLILPTANVIRNPDLSSEVITVTQFPYLMVEFYSHNDRPHHSIITNNPHTGRVVFIVPIDVRSTNSDGAFTYVRSDMVQTIKFKPGDAISFRILTPEGKILTYATSDYFSPYPPVWYRQIKALFRLTPQAGIQHQATRGCQ